MAKVFLSPSTQEHNVGKGDYGTEEKRMNQIADEVQAILTRSGVTVYRNQPSWTITQCTAYANKIGVDYYVAIHSNAGGGRGAEVYAWKNAGRGHDLAVKIYNRLAAITPSKDRGVKDGSHLWEIKAPKAPAVLMEIAFHDNVEDATWIVNNINLIGHEIAAGILEQLGMPLVKPKPPAPKPAPRETAPKGQYYRVQVGAYSEKSNAEAMVAKLKTAGFDAIIKLN